MVLLKKQFIAASKSSPAVGINLGKLICSFADFTVANMTLLFELWNSDKAVTLY